MTMQPCRSVTRDLRYLERNRPRNLPPAPEAVVSFPSLVDRQARLRPDKVAIISAEGEIDWAGLRALSNRVASLLLVEGVRKGDAVALNMENGILYLACVIGITRIGAVASLINTSLAGQPLVHCVRAVDARVSLVGGAALAAIGASETEYMAVAGAATRVIHFAREGSAPAALAAKPWYRDGEALLANAPDDAPELPEPVRAGDCALYIYTSGTTGLPKPARTSHRKVLHGASTMALFGFRARARDRLYNCLPLYHGSGLLVGVAACFHSGASMVLRRHFSASSLIDDANRHGCNLLVYVGEICRYLLATPARPGDAACNLTRAVGNGLRPDIFRAFRRRFGLRRITEFYGASEANGGFMNVLNRDATIGLTAASVRLVNYSADAASIIRGADGWATLVDPGAPGLLLIEVNETSQYEGYRDAGQSEGKLLRDVFAAGDCWFNSGDVLRTVDVGFVHDIPHYQFVDRLGDTFRWKSENVSAIEVSALLSGAPGVSLACAYGVAVPGTDGKAGMAALLPADGAPTIDLVAFADHCAALLPRYARPLFVRIVARMPLTGTHKLIRTELAAEAYDRERVTDPLYCWDAAGQCYTPLDEERLAQIRAGRSGY
jgi:citronellyl-CoA synthetase